MYIFYGNNFFIMGRFSRLNNPSYSMVINRLRIYKNSLKRLSYIEDKITDTIHVANIYSKSAVNDGNVVFL